MKGSITVADAIHVLGMVECEADQIRLLETGQTAEANELTLAPINVSPDTLANDVQVSYTRRTGEPADGTLLEMVLMRLRESATLGSKRPFNPLG